jgi:hypothetical protein
MLPHEAGHLSGRFPIVGWAMDAAPRELMRRDLASAPERRVTKLGPEGPSFRCCENSCYRSIGWLDSQAISGSPPVGPSCGLCRRPTARTLEGRNAPASGTAV